jgi:hypothetical protein
VRRPFALVLLLASCTPVATLRAHDAGSAIAGVWDLVRESRDEAGDRRIERSEWHLQAAGGRVHGFVHRALTYLSTDGVPFRCSGQLQATRSWRTVVEGRLGQGGRTAELGAIASASDPTACGVDSADPVLDARRCRITLVATSRLRVECGSGAIELARRLESPVPVRLAIHDPDTLTGVWTWHHRSVDAEGDVKSETETWRLEQRGSVLNGQYERVVVVRSGDGRRFQCNGALQYTNESRFELRGKIEGRRVRIRELSFQARPHRCETGQRTLDEYEGVLAPGGHAIRLSWGRGAQLLQRRF